MLGAALGKLFALAEAYPDLKANQNFLALQEELSSTENRIGFARQAYNDAATRYNNAREVFPANLISGGFARAELFEIEVAGGARSAQRQVRLSRSGHRRSLPAVDVLRRLPSATQLRERSIRPVLE